jgi:IclR helix-turn-helix domain
MARASRSAQELASRSANEPVILELTPAQVDRVLRHALGAGNMSLLLSGLSDVRDALEDAPWQLEDQRLSRSLLFGLLLLAAFPADRSFIGNAELARILDMNISTVHRYISTLVAVGLLERDPTTRKYRLADVR